VGIAPDLSLPDGASTALPVGDGFCAAAGVAGAPDLFAIAARSRIKKL
jgi:hypothetical protein